VIQGLEGAVRNSNLCGMGDRRASALCGAWELGADRCECLIGGTRQRIEVPDTEWMTVMMVMLSVLTSVLLWLCRSTPKN
jgi:hypothetical protein